MAGVKGRSGGHPNSGRKPSAYTQLKRRIESERVEDAEYAFALYVAVMRNESEPISMRMAAADWVANRVLGKPKEKIEHSGDAEKPLAFNHGIITALLAPRPSGNHSE